MEIKNFKYYHGTSSIFVDSIKRTGLGGLNPNKDFKNLELLAFLFEKAETHLKDNPEYLKIRTTTTAMVRQCPVKGLDIKGKEHTLHFRHDGIYVALAEIKAAVYACLNNYGSEILQRCMTLYKMLCSNYTNFTIPSQINLFQIHKLVNYKQEPILIEISEIDDIDLGKEDGKTAKEALDFLRLTLPTLTDKEKFEFLQHYNFELLKPIPVERLRFFKLTFSGHPANQNFRYKLFEL